MIRMISSLPFPFSPYFSIDSSCDFVCFTLSFFSFFAPLLIGVRCVRKTTQRQRVNKLKFRYYIRLLSPILFESVFIVLISERLASKNIVNPAVYYAETTLKRPRTRTKGEESDSDASAGDSDLRRKAAYLSLIPPPLPSSEPPELTNQLTVDPTTTTSKKSPSNRQSRTGQKLPPPPRVAKSPGYGSSPPSHHPRIPHKLNSTQGWKEGIFRFGGGQRGRSCEWGEKNQFEKRYLPSTARSRGGDEEMRFLHCSYSTE